MGEWRKTLTGTPYLVLFIILISISIGTASALITITLSGDVIITDDLTVDTGTLFVDSTTHKVGIGTTTPSSALDVNGDISFPQGSDRTIGMPQVNNGNHKDLIVQAGGFASSSGSAGRGGNLVLKAGDANQSGPGNPTSASRDNNVKIIAGDNAFCCIEGQLHNGDIQFFAGNFQPERMRLVGNTGNFGIGTTAPNEKLHVVGNVLVSDELMVSGGLLVAGLIEGDELLIAGPKSSHVTTSFGERNLYAIESPTVRFVDEGFSSLVDGTVRIDLEPIFMETIEGQLLIHVTPYGPTTLYVQEIGENYFIVESIDGSDVDFGWYVSAFRQGYSDIRLEETGH